jgi:hypothetical protein
MKKSLCLCAGSLGLLVSKPSSAAVVIVDSGSVTASAFAQVGRGGPLVVGSNSDSFTTAGGSPNANFTAISANADGQFISSSTAARASFNSADVGFITIDLRREFQVDRFTGGGQGNGDFVIGGRNFFYRFTPTIDAILNLTADVRTQGRDLFGLGRFGIGLNGNTVFNVVDPNFSGSTSVNLERGVLYTLTINNFSNIAGGVSSTLNGSVLGQFTFSVVGVAVPEPETWAMMIVGFGFIGGAIRRRKAAIRIAYN